MAFSVQRTPSPAARLATRCPLAALRWHFELAGAAFAASPIAWAQDQQPVSPKISAAGTLNPVVVTGSRSERELQDVPGAIDLLEGDDLDPAKVQDIRGLVRELPNVSVLRKPQRFSAVHSKAVGNGRDGNAGFNLCGLEGNRVLLTVDGIRVPRELSSGVFDSAAFGRGHHDLGLISGVEILRGASSALCGSDGLAGMVARFTTEPKDLLRAGQTLGRCVGLRLDSEDGSRGLGATLASAASDSWQWLGSVQIGHSRELDNQGAAASQSSNRTAPNPQRDRQLSVRGKLVLEPRAASKHVLALAHVDRSGEVEGCSGRSPTATCVQDLNGSSEMQRTRLSGDGRFKTETPWACDLRASLAHQVADPAQVATERRTVVPSLRQRNATHPLSPSRQSGSALRPKLGVMWCPADGWSLLGDLAAGFKAPSPLQRNNFFENVFGNNKTIPSPSPNLKPERSRWDWSNDARHRRQFTGAERLHRLRPQCLGGPGQHFLNPV